MIQVTVHAPMTETLSTLDRVQLQKLLQYAVQEDPAGILGKVFKHLGEILVFSRALELNLSQLDEASGACGDIEPKDEQRRESCNHVTMSFYFTLGCVCVCACVCACFR